MNKQLSYRKPLLLFTVFLIFALESCGSKKTSEPLYDVAGCDIFDQSGKLVRSIMGFTCTFMEDGSYFIQKSEGNIEKISKFGVRENIFSVDTNHPMNLNLKRDRLLVQSTKRERAFGRDVAINIFYVVKFDGTVEKTFSLSDHMIELMSFANKFNLPNSTYAKNSMIKMKWEFSHSNSIYEIPPNPLGRQNLAFAEGNYILCLNLIGLVIVLDHELNKILWVENLGGSLHDAQITPSGKLIYFRNYSDHSNFSYIEAKNPLTGTVISKIQVHPQMGARGGIQELDHDTILYNSMLLNSDKMAPKNKGSAITSDWRGTVKSKYSFQQEGREFTITVKRFDLSEFLKNNRL